MGTMENRSIKKIAIIGAESTGKTDLCERLALRFNTTWVPEYARDYFNHSDIYNYSLLDLERIAIKQMEWEEEKAKEANEVLFCDTALITLKIWAELEFGTCPASILSLMERKRYDYYLITNNEVNWEKDGQRLNKYDRQLIFDLNKQEVKQQEALFGLIQGLHEDRFTGAIRLVEHYLQPWLKP
jgi:NadR type nicotinamide-nucleotide adenylyltransferase